MLPIYKAESFDKILSGGSTRPWLIIVNVRGKPQPYVVKLYKSKHIDESFSVAKDVYCSVLASRLGLETPTPALIEFNDTFINGLPQEFKQELSTKDSRIKFGCEFIDASYSYIDTLHRENLKKYDIESIYAFDNLVKNVDRKNVDGKSNILLKGTSAYLIDHELTLEGIKQAIADFKENRWLYWKERHIFYLVLKNGQKDNKLTYFQDFENALSKMDFNILDSYNKQLIKFNHHNEEGFVLIKEYFCEIKKDAKKFVTLLRAHLS